MGCGQAFLTDVSLCLGLPDHSDVVVPVESSAFIKYFERGEHERIFSTNRPIAARLVFMWSRLSSIARRQ